MQEDHQWYIWPQKIFHTVTETDKFIDTQVREASVTTKGKMI
jgi:hypothetical protein